MQRSMTLLVVVAVFVVGCTTTSPDTTPTTAPPSTTASPEATASTPPPGRVAVVVSPEPALAAATADIGSRRLSGLLNGTELRVVTADDLSFVVDLASFFATEGYDLVCVVGTGADEAVREVAPTAPSTRFCASPARGQDMPANVLAIDLRVQELGYVAGVALAADGVEGEVGLMTSLTTWAPARVAAGLAAGLGAGGVPAPTVRTVGPVAVADEAVEDVTALLGEGVGGLLSLAGDLDAVVRELLTETPVTPPDPQPTATESPPPPPPPPPPPAPAPAPTPTEDRFAALVAGPGVRPEEDGEDLAELVLAVLELHLEAAVELAVERHVEGWDATPASVGLAEGAFRVDVGSGERATAVASVIDDAVAAIREGQLDVPVE